MKLTRENIYINLQGKSKEERKEIVNYLLSINEKCEYNINTEIQRLNTLEYFDNMWFADYSAKTKQEVTIQQLKEILQPMENKEFDKLLTYAKSVEFKFNDLTAYINEEISLSYYEQLEGDELEDKAHLFVLKYKYNNLNLTEQLEKAEAEVKRLKETIEESNKPKVGDICKFWDNGNEKDFIIGKLCNYDLGFYFDYYHRYDNAEKITDQELINKLNELIK